MFSKYLALYWKDLKALLSAISVSKLVASSLEKNYKLFVVSEYFELYSIRLYIGMTIYKASASSIVVPSAFVIELMNGAQFLKCCRRCNIMCCVDDITSY